MVKFLIAGNTGMLGYALMRQAKKKNFDVVGLSHEDMDVAVPESVHDMAVGFGDRIVINAAGVVRGKSADPLAINRMIMANTMGPRVLSRYFSKVVQISTDCVFDGLARHYYETDPVNPLDIYGASKVGGELGPPNLTIRGSFIGFGPGGFVDRMILSQPQDATIVGYSDWQWNGLYVDVFAAIVLELARLPMVGVVHVGGQVVTKSSLVQWLADAFRPDLRVVTEPQGIERNMILRSEQFGVTDYELMAATSLTWESMIKRMADDYSNNSRGAIRSE